MTFKLKKTLPVWATLSVGLILLASMTVKNADKITKEQAVKLAEDFIKRNGYTTFPADKSKLSYELFDNLENNADSILKRRYNTLQSKAFCISHGNGKWDVGFLSTDVNIKKLNSLQIQSDLSGRAVIVSDNGEEIRIAHKTPLFSHFKKL